MKISWSTLFCVTKFIVQPFSSVLFTKIQKSGKRTLSGDTIISHPNTYGCVVLRSKEKWENIWAYICINRSLSALHRFYLYVCMCKAHWLKVMGKKFRLVCVMCTYDSLELECHAMLECLVKQEWNWRSRYKNTRASTICVTLTVWHYLRQIRLFQRVSFYITLFLN